MARLFLQTIFTILLFVTLVNPNKTRLLIGGLFSIYNHPEDKSARNIDIESVRNYEAVRWALNLLNEKNYIEGVKLELVMSHTGNSPEISSLKVGELIYQNSEKACPETRKDPLLAIIGPETSAEAMVTSALLSSVPIEYRIPQVLFSTPTVLLNDRLKYTNILRVIQSEDIHIKSMVKVLNESEWTMIAVIFEDKAHFTQVVHLFKQEVTKLGICIAANYSIDSNMDSVEHFSDILFDIISKNIKGIVFFGRSVHTSTFLEAADSILNTSIAGDRQTNLPVVLFYESAVTSTDVLQKDGKPFISAWGSMIMSPPVSHILEFGNYWLNLFQDVSLLLENSIENPYLLDVFENITGCRPVLNNTSNCSIPSGNKLMKIQVPTLYAPFATHAAFVVAKTLKSVFYEYCKSDINCMKTDQLSYIKIQKELFNASIDYGELEQNNGIVLSGWNNKVVQYLNGEQTTKEYHVKNYRTCESNANDIDNHTCLEMVLVGTYNLDTDKFSFNTEKYRDFISGKEVCWEQRRIAQCPDGHICDACLTMDFSSSVLYYPGDLIIMASMPIHNKGNNPLKCGEIRQSIGLELALAIQYVINVYNLAGQFYKQNGKSKTIGLLLFDTCDDPLVIQEKIINFYRNDLIINGQSIRNKILGNVGPLGSGPTIAVANIVGKLNYVQVGCCSAASFLGDKSLFPMFLRISTPLNKAVDLMLDISLHLGVNTIQIVYGEDEFGVNGKDLTLEMAKKKDICVANNISVTKRDDEDYTDILNRLKEKSQIKVVFIFLRSHVAPAFAKSINQHIRPGDFRFLTSDSWGKRSENIKTNTNLRGTISLSQEMPMDTTHFEIMLSKLRPKRHNENNPFLLSYFQSRLNCYFPWSFNKNYSKKCTENDVLHTFGDEFDKWLPFVVNSVKAFITGTSDAYEHFCGNMSSKKALCDEYILNPTEVRNRIQRVKLKIFNLDELNVFDENGDGVGGFKIYIAELNDGTGLLEYVKIGEKQFDWTMELNTDKIRDINAKIGSDFASFSDTSKCLEIKIRTIEKTEYSVYAVAVISAIIIILNITYLIYRIAHHRRKKLQSADYQHYIDPFHSTSG